MRLNKGGLLGKDGAVLLGIKEIKIASTSRNTWYAQVEDVSCIL